MGYLRTLMLLPCLGGLVGCVVCPDGPSGAAEPAACQFTKEQEETHTAIAHDRETRPFSG
jgi:hypothetical protein